MANEFNGLEKITGIVLIASGVTNILAGAIGKDMISSSLGVGIAGLGVAYISKILDNSDSPKIKYNKTKDRYRGLQ